MKRNFTKMLAALAMLAFLMPNLTAWGQTTVTQTSFSAISGNVNNDTKVSYSSYKGGGTSNPAVNSNAIRLYQNSNGATGGYVVIGVAEGYQITSATIRSTMATTTGYKLTNTDPGSSTPAKNTFNVSNYSLSANTDYTVNNIASQYIVFACFGTTTSSRLYLSKISITYESTGAASVTAPTVTTNSTATSTTTTSITCGGTVTNAGGAATTRGICYMEGTTGDPTTSNTCVAASGTTTSNNSTFSVTLNSLSAGTSYRCRAYATNSEGTGYGTTYTFRTDYSITAQSNNTSWGTVSLTGTTITATPASGYHVSTTTPFSVSPSGSATVVQNDNTFTVTPSANTTVTINFEAIPTHTVTFSINGNTSNTATVAEGEAITFPNNIADINDYTFVGWVAATIAGTTNTAPSFVTSATMGTQDVTFYACFAEVEGSGPDTYEKLASDSFDTNAKYVIGATQASGNNTMWYLNSYSDVDTNVSWGEMTTDPENEAPIQFTLSGTASALVAQDDSGNYLAGLTTGKFKMSSSSTTIALTTTGTIKNSNNGSYYLRHNYNGGNGGLRWYSSDTGSYAYFYKVIPGATYSNYCTTVSTIITAPTVTTNSTATSTTTTTITCGGTVTSTGGAATTRGICYMEGTTGNPTTSNTCVAASGTTTTNNSTFEVLLNNLSAGTNYRCRAYATNSEGTSYGDTYTFRTDYSITVQSNNTDWGTATLTGPTTITASANQGYVISTTNPYTVTSGAATVTDNGDNTFSVVPSSNCTIQINFEAIPTHTAYFSVNGTVTSSQNFAEGANIVFPNDPADIEDKTFVGWITFTIVGTTNTAPAFINTATETMGNNDITYYACFAKETPGTGQNYINTITTSTSGVPVRYETSNEFVEHTLNGVTFMIQQMYYNSNSDTDALQFRAAGNNNGTGTIYNSEDLGSISSVIINYTAKDTNRNFTLNVGNEENPSDGTSINPTINGNEYTFDCSSLNVGYFVLTNGTNAGYLSSIVITYFSGTPSTYSDYCTTVITAPTNLSVTNLLATSATLSWTGQQSSYEVQYRISGASAWTTISPATSPLNVTGLTADTDYEWQVRGIDGNTYTNWVSADFHTPVTYNVYLTISPANSGTITREGGTWDGDHGVYSDGETATLTAAANIGYTFNNWIANGTVVSTATYSTTITGNVSIVANFTKNTYPITVAANPTEGGTVTGGGTYEHGQSCTVTATPTVGYTFNGWFENNTLVSSNANYQFTVEGARDLEARFTLNNYVITVSANPSAGGNITHTGGSWEGFTGIYNHGDAATLTASANTGYTFSGWYESNALVYSLATYTIDPVTSAHTLEARFTLNTHTLTINYQYANGSQAASQYSQTYSYGESYSVASPSITGYTPDIDIVSGTMGDADVTVTVTYTINSHMLTINYVDGNNNVMAPQYTATLNYHDTYSVNSPAVTGYTPDQATVSGTMQDEDVTVTVTYSPNSYTLTINYLDGNGNVVAPQYTATLSYNTYYSVNSPAVTGYTPDIATVSGTMGIENVTVNVTYTINQHTLTINYVFAGGGEAAPTYTETLDYDEAYNVESPAVAGYTPDVATVSGNMPDNDLTVTVTYTVATYTITTVASPTAGGTISGSGTYTHGATATLEATANTGYSFRQWSDGVATNPRTVTVTSDATYTAEFTPNSYTITVTASPTEGGTVTGGGSYNYGTTATLTATANAGYSFSQWSDGNTDNPRTVNVNGPANYTAVFTLISYTIEVSAGQGGTASVNGTTSSSYHYGESATVIATPSDGNVFQNWTENGTSVSTDATYTFTVTGSRDLVANFTMAPPTVTTDDIASGAISKTSVAVSGSVSYSGTVTEHGFCWSTSPNAVVVDLWYARVGSGTGNFSTTITGLQPNTLYYVRAYASTDGQQTFVYGAEKSFYTLADVTTATATDVHTIDVTLNGSYASNNNANVSCGFVYSITATNANPTLGGTGCTTVAAESAGTPFSANVTGLTGSTGYSVRAYATNDSGTTYGAVVTFTTMGYYSLAAIVTPSEGGEVSFSPAGDITQATTHEATIGNGTITQNTLPFNARQSSTLAEMIYPHTSDMVKGKITKISFHNFTNGAVNHNVKIYLKHVGSTSTIADYISLTDAVMCYDSIISCGSGAWAEIKLQTQFDYNGDDNLLVAVNYTGANPGYSGTRNWYATNMGYYCSLVYWGTGVTPDNLSQDHSLLQNLPNMKIEFSLDNGATQLYHYGAEVTLTATPNAGYAFDNWTENGSFVSSDASYTINSLTADRTLTANFHEVTYKRFVTQGAWNVANNWSPTGVPTAADDVIIAADATIPSGCVAEVNEIVSITSDGSITIADGGQLVHNNSASDPVTLTIDKYVQGYGVNNYNSNKGYYLYSSPINVSATNFDANTEGFIDSEAHHQNLFYFDYDNIEGNMLLEWIYAFNNTTDLDADLVRNRGYIYASQSNTTLKVTGEVLASNVDQEVALDYTANSDLRFNGWNLMGNPFVCNAYVTAMSGGNATDLDFFVLNSDGSEFTLPQSGVNYIAPASAIMVKANATGESIVYSREGNASGDRTGLIDIAVAPYQEHPDRSSQGLLDRARIRFGEGNGLEKFQLDPSHTKVYIPKDGKDYAVVYAEPVGVVPVNFKAESNGSYTLSFDIDEVSFNYLHLIDNMTGADVDLLALRQAQGPASYSFSARMTDYESRFKIVFATNNAGDADGSDSASNFAFYTNGTWVIYSDGDATLQVVDVLGHILSSERIDGTVRKAIQAAPGVYMLRLIQGSNVKVQKIVVER